MLAAPRYGVVLIDDEAEAKEIGAPLVGVQPQRVNG
jgi:hypothetical protein